MLGYIRRRFSSGDVQGEGEEGEQQQQQQQPSQTPQPTPPPLPQPQQQQQQQQKTSATSFFSRRGPSPSAPTSPSKSASSSALTNPFASGSGGGGGAGSSGGSAGFASQIGLSRSIFGKAHAYNKDRCKTLLVIDEPHTDWSKYFRGRKILTDYDIRVEQAVFADIRLTANTHFGCTVELMGSGGQQADGKSARSFKPDFVLVRQHVRDADKDWRRLIIGFMHAGVPTINSAMALFNCSERAWLFAHLAQIQSRVGDENFPLIEQNYFPCYQDLTVAQDNFPMAMKIGHAHSGLGKIKISGPDEYRDVSGALAVAGTYATTEALVDAKFDIHIQKIGAYYKAYARRSISGNWKANVSSAMLEQLNMTDKFRQWIDEVARLFGGLDICSVETVQHKNGRVFIIEANGSDMPLIGDSQEEDRRAIAELTLSRMHHACSEAAVLAAQRAKSQQPLGDQQHQQQQKVNGASTPESSDRRRQQQQPRPQQMQNSLDEGDDTMRNLRKTFAGIFGDM